MFRDKEQHKKQRERIKMFKEFIKENVMLEDLQDEIEIYEDELQDGGHVAIELYDGLHSKKGYDFDVNVVLNDEDGEELNRFHFFSYSVTNQEIADRKINLVKEVVEKNGLELKGA